ncbi:hypothetical protein AB1Y20_012102 [Prymnesium parvum]|uniref:Uncharacterized protein n=1 Tax=Prymnesium parvum TaxID=97485 RepID=A0AB34IMI4_PRYPA
MGLGPFELLHSPSAGLQLQTFQCPETTWLAGGTANVAFAARAGAYTVIIVGDDLHLFDDAHAAPILTVGRADGGEHDYTFGELRLRRSPLSAESLKWRLETAEFILASHSYTAPPGLVSMHHMMDFQVALRPIHSVSHRNSGLLAHTCPSTLDANGKPTCVHSDCESIPAESVLFNQVNRTLYRFLMESCSVDKDAATRRSPCSPPTSDDACRATGFPIVSARAACRPLAESAAFDSCVYDCCVTANAEFCQGLALESNEAASEFIDELILDGRFVNSPPPAHPPSPPSVPPPPPPSSPPPPPPATPRHPPLREAPSPPSHPADAATPASPSLEIPIIAMIGVACNFILAIACCLCCIHAKRRARVDVKTNKKRHPTIQVVQSFKQKAEQVGASFKKAAGLPTSSRSPLATGKSYRVFDEEFGTQESSDALNTEDPQDEMQNPDRGNTA